MTTLTHCLPGGSLGSFGIPTPRVDSSLIRVDNPSSGLRRGRVILLPGIGGSTAASPFWENNFDGNAFRAALNADGWQTVQASGVPQNGLQWAQMNGQPYGGIATTYGGEPTAAPGCLADITNDSGNGARLLATCLHHFDHVYQWAEDNYGTMPAVVVGESWGGWLACQVALARASGVYPVKAVYSHNTPNDFSDLNPGVGVYVLLGGWQQQGSAAYAGMNLVSTSLNGVTIPLRVTWGYLDNVVTGGNGTNAPPIDCMNMVANASLATGGTVQSGSSTVSSGQTGVDTNGAAWLAGTGTLGLSSIAGFSASGGNAVITGLGGAGTVAFSYSGYSGTTLQGCSTAVAPPGITTDLVTGALVQTLVAAGGRVTGAGMLSDHGWGVPETTDALAWFTGAVDPLFPKVY